MGPPDKFSPDEVLRHTFGAFPPDPRTGRVDGLRIRAWVRETGLSARVDARSLVACWDRADTERAGTLDEAGFLRFGRALRGVLQSAVDSRRRA